VRAAAWLMAGALLLVLGGPASAETGVTDSEIVIGCSTSLTGPLGFNGEQATRFGVDVYFKTVNAAGGIHGRKIRTIYYDDASTPARALENTKRLVERDGVFAVIAPLGTTRVAATLEFLETHRVPLIFPFQDSPVVRGRKHVIAGTMLADRQSRLTIDYLVGQRKLKRFAAVHLADDYGRFWLQSLQKDLARHGVALVATEAIKPGSTNLNAEVDTLKAANPDVILLALTPTPAAALLKQREKIGWTGVLMVAVGPLVDDRYLALAASAADGVEGLALWPDAATSSQAGVVQYREDLARAFRKNPPNAYSLPGYFAAMLFAEGVKRAGRELTRDGLIAALESLQRWDTGILPPLTIGPDHETQKQGYWATIDRGRFKPVTDWLTSP